MAWNQPGNSGQGRGPWGSNKPDGNSEGNGNKGDRGQGPPDLDDIFHKLGKRLGGLNGGKDGLGGDNNAQTPCGPMGGRIVGIVAAAVVTIWAASGSYTIRGVECDVVTRFDKFNHLVEPDLNWKPTFIDSVQAVNVESVRELAASDVMLTFSENVVRAEMNVQYRVIDLGRYLPGVISTDDSLCQATDNALHGVIGKYITDRILTEGRTVIHSDTRREPEETIRPCSVGITSLDVNFQMARPPEGVKATFSDTIAACENEQQYIREAEAHINEVQPRVNGRVQYTLEETRTYKTQTVPGAQGEIACLTKLLPGYEAAPETTRERLYIEAMKKVLSHTRKVLVNGNRNDNLMVLPFDQILKGTTTPAARSDSGDVSDLLRLPPVFSTDSVSTSSTSSSTGGSIMGQCRINAQRNDYQRQGE